MRNSGIIHFKKILLYFLKVFFMIYKLQILSKLYFEIVIFFNFFLRALSDKNSTALFSELSDLQKMNKS